MRKYSTVHPDVKTVTKYITRNLKQRQNIKQELKTMTKYFENIYTKCHQKLKTSLTFNQNCKNEIISRQKLNKISPETENIINI